MTEERPPAGSEPTSGPAATKGPAARGTGLASALGRAFGRRPLVIGAVAAAALALLAGLALSSGPPKATVATDKPGAPLRDPDAGLQVVAGAPPEAGSAQPSAPTPADPAPPAVRAESHRREAGDDALAEADRYERAQQAGVDDQESDPPPPRVAPRARPNPGDQPDREDSEDEEEPRPPPPPPPSWDR